jgi:predicted aldo/keto reductase-like oxidoreductase
VEYTYDDLIRWDKTKDERYKTFTVNAFSNAYTENKPIIVMEPTECGAKVTIAVKLPKLKHEFLARPLLF